MPDVITAIAAIGIDLGDTDAFYAITQRGRQTDGRGPRRDDAGRDQKDVLRS